MSPRDCLVILAIYLLPLTASARSLLVDTDWLVNKLGSADIAIVDMSDSIQYTRFHIPGARHLPYDAINQANQKQISLSIGSQAVARLMGERGISPDMHVVIYDDTGGLNASRLFWELERLGHANISLLDGGLVKWVLEGKRVVAEPANYPAKTYKSVSLKGRNNLASIDDLLPANRPHPVLLDVRSEEEYIGYPQQKVSGHIPGAKWWHWEDNVNFAKAFQLQPTANLLTHTATLGLGDKQQEIVVYCHSGHRAAQAYFTLRQLGYSQVRLYDGSMAEYGQRRPATLVRGKQP